MDNAYNPYILAQQFDEMVYNQPKSYVKRLVREIDYGTGSG